MNEEMKCACGGFFVVTGRKNEDGIDVLKCNGCGREIIEVMQPVEATADVGRG